MSMKVVPTAAVLGAEITGVDLSRPLDDATFAAIERAYDEYGVIFFRGQSITPAQQVAFTRRFGEIEFNIMGDLCVHFDGRFSLSCSRCSSDRIRFSHTR